MESLPRDEYPTCAEWDPEVVPRGPAALPGIRDPTNACICMHSSRNPGIATSRLGFGHRLQQVTGRKIVPRGTNGRPTWRHSSSQATTGETTTPDGGWTSET